MKKCLLIMFILVAMLFTACNRVSTTVENTENSTQGKQDSSNNTEQEGNDSSEDTESNSEQSTEAEQDNIDNIENIEQSNSSENIENNSEQSTKADGTQDIPDIYEGFTPEEIEMIEQAIQGEDEYHLIVDESIVPDPDPSWIEEEP